MNKKSKIFYNAELKKVRINKVKRAEDLQIRRLMDKRLKVLIRELLLKKNYPKKSMKETGQSLLSKLAVWWTIHVTWQG